MTTTSSSSTMLLLNFIKLDMIPQKLKPQFDHNLMTFNEIEEKGVLNWNAIISGFVKVMNWHMGWDVFLEMQYRGLILDHFTFASAIRICGVLRSLIQCKQVHAKLIVCGFQDDTFIGNSLIDMYAKCDDDEKSFLVFNQMEQRDQVSWNSIISSLTQINRFEEALSLYFKMCKSGFKCDRFNLGSMLMATAGLENAYLGRQLHGCLFKNLLDVDVVLGSALVDMYSKCGLVSEARKVFDKLNERNEVSYNALIAGYVLDENVEEAIKYIS